MLDCDVTRAGMPFLVLEYLRGETLAARILRVRHLPIADVVLIVRQIGSALAATHAAGIVHRDIKPANIFLLKTGGEPLFAKLLDFGVSVRTDGTRTTGQRVVIGTPDYMAPEQALGRSRDVTPSIDQYSLATIAWEMLSGDPPFRRHEAADLLACIINADPPSMAIAVPWVPSAAESVLRRALHKKPERRFATILEFALALASALEPRPPTAPPPSQLRWLRDGVSPDELAVVIDHLEGAHLAFARGDTELASELADVAMGLDSKLVHPAARTVLFLATPPGSGW